MQTPKKYLVALRDVPPAGKDFQVADADVWNAPLAEYHVDGRLEGDPVMDLTVLPVDDGWLLRGSLRADMIVPCSRCASDAKLAINAAIEDYVQKPEEGEALPEDTFAEGDDHLVFDHGALLLDLAAIAWEQLMLAMPAHPLCRPDCKGICPHCGQDLNQGSCQCAEQDGDPRLAVLRGLKVKKS